MFIFTSILNFILHCIVLELTEMSVKLMDNVVCNELPVIFLLSYAFILFTVFILILFLEGVKLLLATKLKQLVYLPPF